MLEILQDRAALYAAGTMLPAERAEFELLLEFHEELQQHVSGLLAVTAAVMVATSGDHRPPASLKDRILAAVPAHPPGLAEATVAKVRTDASGLIEWVNADFTAMCGYELAELRGRKPGMLLQGVATNRDEIAALRAGIREVRPVEAEVVNYHKNGSPYRVHIAITPICDDDRKPLFYVAKERRLSLVA